MILGATVSVDCAASEKSEAVENIKILRVQPPFAIKRRCLRYVPDASAPTQTRGTTASSTIERLRSLYPASTR